VERLDKESEDGIARAAFEVVPDDVGTRGGEIEIREPHLADQGTAGFELIASENASRNRVTNFVDDLAQLSWTMNRNLGIVRVAGVAHPAAA
jgi:hypothetical protein